jgi:hypothetical protein
VSHEVLALLGEHQLLFLRYGRRLPEKVVSAMTRVFLRLQIKVKSETKLRFSMSAVVNCSKRMVQVDRLVLDANNLITAILIIAN